MQIWWVVQAWWIINHVSTDLPGEARAGVARVGLVDRQPPLHMPDVADSAGCAAPLTSHDWWARRHRSVGVHVYRVRKLAPATHLRTRHT